ncbi:VOC family protein [Streptomyces sp. NBC_01754]|uniref:VOC family protein n=1 Tax=Streptomyces sp. NBC_01754 TaxID=2975930 RepID=UPI002DDB5857|nr:VOC family protein [Streptomyces sp. NBC_01754]WSC95941.1 VOC family protein [Streptomyces sp. NBC_01754]
MSQRVPVVRGIDHVGVTVPDIESATAFFRDALGADVLYDTRRREEGPRTGRPVERRLGLPEGASQVAVRMLALPHGPGLELFEYRSSGQREPVVPSDLGWQHLAVYVDDIDEALAGVEEAGGARVGDPGPLPGAEAGERNRMVYTRTPWGSTLELITYPDTQPYEEHTPRRRWRP